MSNSTSNPAASENPTSQAPQEGGSNVVGSEPESGGSSGDGTEAESEQWSDRVLNFSENPLQESEQTIGRLALSMFVVGIGIGLTALLMWNWIEAVVIPEVAASERQVITGLIPLAFLSIATLSAPILASIIGLRQGGHISSREDLAVVGIGCLTGAVLLVFVAGAFIGQTGGESPVGPLDLIALAGLAGIVSALLAALLSLLTSE